MDTAWVNDIPVRIKKQSGGLIVGYIPEGVTFSQENNVVARVDKKTSALRCSSYRRSFVELGIASFWLACTKRPSFS